MRTNRSVAATLAASVLLAGVTHAGEVVIQVRGVRGTAGNVGCALFSANKGFPMDNSAARQHWVSATEGGATCRFDNVDPGTYAVSVGHDMNGNRRVDTNVFGIPTEGWAVSRNVVPTLRAPRFEDAAFQVEGSSPVTLSVDLVY